MYKLNNVLYRRNDLEYFVTKVITMTKRIKKTQEIKDNPIVYKKNELFERF